MTTPLADKIAPYLPYLRRFARALTGAQERGDAYVVAMLETLVADRRNFNTALKPKLAVYQAFLKVWNAMPMNRVADQADANLGGLQAVADRRIETLTPLPRQAFLLAAVEEFSTDEIAAILDLDKSKVVDLIDAAGKEISQQIMARVMIIEDEPLIALDIESLVVDIGHNVCGIARTKREAVQLARSSSPQMILADIQLADGSSGVDAVNEILSEINVPVIFITAYPERLLTGERAEPTFLITKPFKPEMVKAIISQALFFDIQAAVGSKHVLAR